MIDLHCHSTASDGTDSPAQLIAHAAAAGLRTVAITDHDTTGGWDEASAAVRQLTTPLTLIRGAEFSCVHTASDGRTVPLHILGYLFNPEAPQLKAERARLRGSRQERAREIVSALVADGYPISWDQVAGLAGDGTVGRPHIAQALQQAGVVASIDEAFNDLLSTRSRYYRSKADAPATEMIELINRAGGAAVVAHVWSYRRDPVLDEAGIAELVVAGLAGIEVDHADHDQDRRSRLRALVADWNLIGTGSSDYHGTHKSVQLGGETTSERALEQLLTRTSGVQPVDSDGGQ